MRGTNRDKLVWKEKCVEKLSRISFSSLWWVSEIGRFWILSPLHLPILRSSRKRKKPTRLCKVALARALEIFDYPFSERLAPLLKNEVDR